MGQLNTLDYVTISTTGNATDFGDLTQARYGISGVLLGVFLQVAMLIIIVM
jgi:hypothetical protein